MVEKIKFHLDESVSNAIALGLRRRGIDVTALPTSWGKMFAYDTFWANAVRPYIVRKVR